MFLTWKGKKDRETCTYHVAMWPPKASHFSRPWYKGNSCATWLLFCEDHLQLAGAYRSVTKRMNFSPCSGKEARQVIPFYGMPPPLKKEGATPECLPPEEHQWHCKNTGNTHFYFSYSLKVFFITILCWYVVWKLVQEKKNYTNDINCF